MLNTQLDRDIQVEIKKPEIPVSLSPVLVDIGYSFLTNLTIEEYESLKNFLGRDTQVFRILAAGTREYVKDGVLTWQSPGFEGTDNNGLSSGGVYRVGAGAIAMKILPEAKVIVGSKYADDSKPSPNIVMREEIKMLGLDQTRILSDPDTLDSIAELVRLIEICEVNGWSNGLCITNEYHCARVLAILLNLSWLSFPIERTEAFLNGLKKIRDGELKIRVIPAEEVIKRYNESIYNKHLKDTLGSPKIEQRKENERIGVNLIASGTYKRNKLGTSDRIILSRNGNSPVTLT